MHGNSPSTGAIFCWFPSISWELVWKWSIWNSNPHSYVCQCLWWQLNPLHHNASPLSGLLIHDPAQKMRLPPGAMGHLTLGAVCPSWEFSRLVGSWLTFTFFSILDTAPPQSAVLPKAWSLDVKWLPRWILPGLWKNSNINGYELLFWGYSIDTFLLDNERIKYYQTISSSLLACEDTSHMK